MPSAQTVFGVVDSMDPAATANLLAEDARMRFGNADLLVGWRVDVDDRIEDYRVFYDVSPVFAPG
jgi:hypothetical protein